MPCYAVLAEVKSLRRCYKEDEDYKFSGTLSVASNINGRVDAPRALVREKQVIHILVPVRYVL